MIINNNKLKINNRRRLLSFQLKIVIKIMIKRMIKNNNQKDKLQLILRLHQNKIKYIMIMIINKNYSQLMTNITKPQITKTSSPS